MTLLALLRAQWDRAVGGLLVAGGLVSLLAGVIGMSGRTDDPVDQLSFVASGVLGGVFSIGLGSALLVSARLADRWRRAADAETDTRLVVKTESPNTTSQVATSRPWSPETSTPSRREAHV